MRVPRRFYPRNPAALRPPADESLKQLRLFTREHGLEASGFFRFTRPRQWGRN